MRLYYSIYNIMTKSKTPKNKKMIDRLITHRAKEKSGGGEKKVVGGVINPANSWPYITISSKHSNNIEDENASLQNLIYKTITTKYRNGDNIEYEDLKNKFESVLEKLNKDRKGINPLEYTDKIKDKTFNMILSKIKENKKKQEEEKKKRINVSSEFAREKQK